MNSPIRVMRDPLIVDGEKDMSTMDSISDSMVTDVLTVAPDMSVGDVIAFIEGKNIRAVPVVDENRKMLGVFSTSVLIKRLLPVSATIEDGLQRLSFAVGAKDTIIKHLEEIKRHPVRDFMDSGVFVVSPETHTWEGLRLLTKHGSPIPVVDEKTGKLIGIISDQSALKTLQSFRSTEV